MLDLGLRRAAGVEEGRAQPVSHRRVPVGRFGVDQAVLEPRGAIEMRNGRIVLFLAGSDISGQHFEGDRDSLSGGLSENAGIFASAGSVAMVSSAWRSCTALSA